MVAPDKFKGSATAAEAARLLGLAPEQVVAAIRQAVDRDQTDPTVHDHLGDLYEKTGRIRQAAAQWELSLQEFARSLPADVESSEVSKLHKKLESARVKLAKEDSLLGPPKDNQREQSGAHAPNASAHVKGGRTHSVRPPFSRPADFLFRRPAAYLCFAAAAI